MRNSAGCSYVIYFTPSTSASPTAAHPFLFELRYSEMNGTNSSSGKKMTPSSEKNTMAAESAVHPEEQETSTEVLRVSSCSESYACPHVTHGILNHRHKACIKERTPMHCVTHVCL